MDLVFACSQRSSNLTDLASRPSKTSSTFAPRPSVARMKALPTMVGAHLCVRLSVLPITCHILPASSDTRQFGSRPAWRHALLVGSMSLRPAASVPSSEVQRWGFSPSSVCTPRER